MQIKKYRYAMTAYVLLILLGSSIPADHIPESELFSLDKLLHIVEYSILGFLAFMSFPNRSLRKILIILIICMFFSAFDETWQSFIPGRQPDLLDFLADNLGIWIGTGLGISLLFLKGND
ncbi:MAG: VanZ family protein [Candidatus Marinimicrobia bacterium]|nr:VanZ family protein [Candidatus Neomarinimicrobiota bacterium]